MSKSYQGVSRRRLITAVIMAALIAVCVSGCHVHMTAHAGPPLHPSAVRR